jgi:TonB family protein
VSCHQGFFHKKIFFSRSPVRNQYDKTDFDSEKVPMKTRKFYSTIFAMTFLCISLPTAMARAQTQENPQQKVPLVIRKSTGVLQRSAIHRVEPEYPQEARAQGIHGVVVLEVRLDQKGNVIATTPVSGQQLLVDATIKAMQSWKFAPTQLGGVAVQVIGNVSFLFAADGKVSDVVTAPTAGSGLPNESINFIPDNSPPFISDKEVKELSQKLQNAYDIPLRISNPDDLVLEIVKATVRAVKRDEQNYLSNDPATPYVTDYAMQLAISLHNRTDKKITGVGFKFTNTAAHHIFFAYPHITGVPAQGDYPLSLKFMAAAGNPADLLVEIIGVQFADGTIGGAFPIPPHAVGRAPMAKDDSGKEFTPPPVQVTTKPRPLNRLRPNYTVQARQNKVSGTVRLRVEVGADGSAKRIHVANALPDGLTEEAIRVIKVLQFQPALAAGTPVAFWIVMDVEFYLR